MGYFHLVIVITMCNPTRKLYKKERTGFVHTSTNSKDIGIKLPMSKFAQILKLI